MTYDEYDALPGINASAIARGRISMKHMRHYIGGTDRKDT